MSFDIRQLDKLAYDEAEPLLEDYIFDLINQFAVSEIGQAHTADYPEGGDWIGTFIEFAYLYGELTLPQITKSNAQELMENILPRKLTLLDPSETDHAIPELVAFWTFLKAEYKLKSANAIIKYLHSIEDRFGQWMFDAERGGFAKNFVIQGMQAGYDMSDQADVEAFQAEYNRRLQATEQATGKANKQGSIPIANSTVSGGISDNQQGNPPSAITSALAASLASGMPEMPEELEMLFNMLGLDLPTADAQTDPTQFMSQMLVAMTQIGEALDMPAAEIEDLKMLQSVLESDSLGELAELEEPLSEEAIACLKAQIINETEPGSVVQDFQTLLSAIGEKGLKVSNKQQFIPRKQLIEINQQLTRPLNIDLQRPQQKSLSHIHGLYLLLKATGIGKVIQKGKQPYLVLNAEIHDAWQQLNATERYCALLEAWMVRGYGEMIGESRGYARDGEGFFCLQQWPQLSARKIRFDGYARQHDLKFYPGYHNLALMELFGLIRITHGKPSKGKGWRVRSFEATSFGKALMALIKNVCVSRAFFWEADTNLSHPLNELQPYLQPYFPEWENSLPALSFAFSPGRHIFKVSLGKCWRRLAIPGQATLDDLGELVRLAFNFDSDHLDRFTYQDQIGRSVQVNHPFNDYAETQLFTDKVTVGSLPLSVGSNLEYCYDFGDSWTFSLVLESREPIPEQGIARVKGSKRGKRKAAVSAINQGEILESHGEAPEQYPDYDDW